MTATETIRQAVQLMRTNAQAATAGPWTTALVWSPDATVTSGIYSDAHPTGTAKSVVVGSRRRGTGGVRDPRDARHMASWQPVVALAVADWLEDEAERIDSTPYMVDADWIERNYRAALAVARAYIEAASR